MKLQSILMIGTLCIAGSSSLLMAKSREFTIDKAVMCGNVQLAAGTYRVAVRGDKAEIISMNHFADKKPMPVTANVLKTDQKYRTTEVKVNGDNSDVPRVSEIDLGGTHTSLSFGE